MSKLSKAVALAAVGSAAMAVSGAGMAAGVYAPGVFSIDNNLVVVGGDVSADCPAGGTCQNLPGTGDGMLLRSVDVGGTFFIQTIIAENLLGGGLFANEQSVQQGVSGTQNGTNIAQKMVIDDVAQGFNAEHIFVGTPYQTAPTSPDPLFVMNQTLDLGNGAEQKIRIKGVITAAGGDVADQVDGGVSKRAVYIDQRGGPLEPEFGDFVYRWANTPATAQNLDLDNGQGSVTTGATNTNVGAVYIAQSVTGMDNDFGLLKFGTGLGTGGTGTGTWTTPLVSIDVLAGNPSSNVVSEDPAEGYGHWGTGSNAEAVFGGLDDLSDFLP